MSVVQEDFSQLQPTNFNCSIFGTDAINVPRNQCHLERLCHIETLIVF